MVDGHPHATDRTSEWPLPTPQAQWRTLYAYTHLRTRAVAVVCADLLPLFTRWSVLHEACRLADVQSIKDVLTLGSRVPDGACVVCACVLCRFTCY